MGLFVRKAGKTSDFREAARFPPKHGESRQKKKLSFSRRLSLGSPDYLITLMNRSKAACPSPVLLYTPAHSSTFANTFPISCCTIP